jgi:putative ABC transport system permease protein
MNGTVTFLLLLIGFVALLSLALMLRQRLSLRIALRNARRGRWRTVLVVLGLLVATTIISGSLVIGDTVDAVSVHFTYQAIGYTDEGIYNQTPTGLFQLFPYAAYSEIAQASAGNPNVAGLAPEIISPVQLLDRSTGVPQPGLTIIGANANQTDALGDFTADNGSKLAGPSAGGVYLDDQAAQDVNASVGDRIVLYGTTHGTTVLAVPATVQAIVQDDVRGGFFGGGNVFADLATAQSLLNVTGLINFIAVTNTGSLSGGVGVSTSVSQSLNATIAGLHPSYGLSATPLLSENLQQAETSGQSLSDLFLVLGLFSVVAGAMLIVGIFVMLADERKGEMGMLRAIGLRRGQLVSTYYFEGLLYSAGSAALGTFLGVGVGYGLVYAFSVYFASSTVTASAILDSFTATPISLLTAYVVGFLLTLLTVVATSFWVARLNIVRAIRSVPEPPPSRRSYTYLAYVGVVFTLLGAQILRTTYAGTTNLSDPRVGGALLFIGVALIASRFLANRWVFSTLGVALVIWSGVPDLSRWLLGTQHSGGIDALFADGILMVLGAILVYVFNSSLVVRAVTRIAGRQPRTVSVVRIGLSYPGRRPFRTAINLVIFALVLFTVVSVASIGSSLQANLNGLVVSESGGYTFFGYSSQPIPDLPGQVANNSTLAPLYSNVVPLVAGGAEINYSGSGGAFEYSIFAAPDNAPASQDFYTTNHYNFTSTWHGMSASAAFQELSTNGSVAIVDSTFNGPPSPSGVGPAVTTVTPGTVVNVSNPLTGAVRSVTIIGILAQAFVTGIWVAPTTAAALGYQGDSAFFFTTTAGTSVTHADQVTKAAFFAYGLILYNFAQILQKSIQSTEAILGLLEVFVALGLAVGIAAMGIVALRAVAERRGEIGMLRAAGFTRNMVLRVFLLEYSYVALLGIVIGTSLAILLIYDASQNAANLLAFSIPWTNIAIVISIAYVLTVAAILGPSLKASRLPPAEAIRYSE